MNISLDTIEKELHKLPSPVSFSLSATHMLESSVESYDTQFLGNISESFSGVKVKDPLNLYYVNKSSPNTCFKNFMKRKGSRTVADRSRRNSQPSQTSQPNQPNIPEPKISFNKMVSCCTSFDDNRTYSKADKVACTDDMTGRKTCTYTNTEGESFVCNDAKTQVKCGCAVKQKIEPASCAKEPASVCPCMRNLGTKMLCVKKHSLTEYEQYAKSLREEADAKKTSYLKQYNDFQEKIGNAPPATPPPVDKKPKCVCPEDLLERIKKYQKNMYDCQEYAQKVRIESDLRKEGLRKPEEFKEVCYGPY